MPVRRLVVPADSMVASAKLQAERQVQHDRAEDGPEDDAGKTFLEVFQAKLERELPTVAGRAPGVEVPAALEEAIGGGLHADLQRRYGTAREFRDRLVASLDE